MYLVVFRPYCMALIYVPIRPSRRDPELEELEDNE